MKKLSVMDYNYNEPKMTFNKVMYIVLLCNTLTAAGATGVFLGNALKKAKIESVEGKVEDWSKYNTKILGLQTTTSKKEDGIVSGIFGICAFSSLFGALSMRKSKEQNQY